MDEPSLRIAAGWLMQHYSTAMAKLGEIANVKQELEAIVQKQEMDSINLREQLSKTQSDLGHSQAAQQTLAPTGATLALTGVTLHEFALTPLAAAVRARPVVVEQPHVGYLPVVSGLDRYV